MHLNSDEINLIKNTEILRLKTQALYKVEQGFQELQMAITELLKKYELYPIFQQFGLGKISRGENYKGLPYRVLDHPAIFKKEGILACRTMFLWGQYFSFTLHLSGKYLDSQRMNLFNQIDEMQKNNSYFCIHNNPWEYYLESNNYLLSKDIKRQDLEHYAMNKDFIKLSCMLALEDYQQIEAAGITFYHQQFDWLKNGLK